MRLPPKVRFLVTIGLVAIAVWSIFALLGLRLVRVARPSEALRQGTGYQPRLERHAEANEAMPRNLVLVIADGFGFAHLSAARTVLHGINGAAVWDRFESTGWQRTHPAAGFLTESAAAATALATGHPTGYESIGVDTEGRPLETLFEMAAAAGYATGDVTDSYVWDATPAAFITHSPQRGNDNAEGALRQLGESSLDILVGELEDVGEGEVPEWGPSIELLGARFEVLGPGGDDALIRRLGAAGPPIAAIFEEDQITDLGSTPALPELTAAALERLRSDGRPYLFLVESEESDSASHDRDFDRLLGGLEALEATLELVLDAAAEDGDTLVVFTSDHETGGLALGIADGRNMALEAIWATEDHTGSVVPVMAVGPGAAAFGGSRTNWEIGQLLRRSLEATPVEALRAD